MIPFLEFCENEWRTTDKMIRKYDLRKLCANIVREYCSCMLREINMQCCDYGLT